MTGAYDGRQVVGMDLHRRRSVLVRMTEDHIWPDRDESTRAAVDAVLGAYLTEQRRNSATAGT